MTELASVLATAADWLAAVHPDDRQEIQDLLNLSDDESAHALPEGPRDRTRSGSRADGALCAASSEASSRNSRVSSRVKCMICFARRSASTSLSGRIYTRK